jgi:hypothetical protein
MATAPILSQFIAVDTVGALAQRIIDDVNEPVSDRKLNSLYGHIGDGIESIWMSAMLATLSKFVKGPVTQIVTQQTTNIVSVPDPVDGGFVVSQIPGGNLPARTVYFSFCLVTESGSTTAISPLRSQLIAANFLSYIPSPLNPSSQTIPEGVIGWYMFAGYNPDGSDQGQQSPVPLLFNQTWYEPPAGLTQAPNAPAPPSINTTGDNIFAINRIDVMNEDKTWTNWIQSNIGGTWWTEFQHKIATTTTWMPFVYDLIDNRQLEVRPAPADSLSAVYFYVHKPRRPRFPQSRLPFTSFACQGFLYTWGMARFLRSIYEFEASDRWAKDAEAERLRIVLQIGQGNWNRDSTIRPFMR